jgi:integrase
VKTPITQRPPTPPDAASTPLPAGAPAPAEAKQPRRTPLSGKKKRAVKPLAGSVQEHHGWWTLRVRIGDTQPRMKLGKVSEMSQPMAEEKAAVWRERMAREQRGEASAAPARTTVKEHFESWISGEMFEKYGAVNGLKPKKSADVDSWRAGKYVYKVIGSKSVAEVTEQDIDKIMAGIPADRRAGTRAKVYALLHRGFDLAIVPARLRKDSPVTRYHKPAKDAPKLFGYLFPAELLALLACVAIPLGRRVLYAMAVYTGLRKSSLLALPWTAVDLDNRTLLSRVSKNGIAQLFEIPPGLVWVLRAWYEICGRPARSAAVVSHAALMLRGGGRPRDGEKATVRQTEAQALRADLIAAGVTREVLFLKGPNVEPLRFHDGGRATFVTWAKRAGKSDGWISDRTGHLSPEMIQRYNRAARTLEDLRIEPFPELTGTIPELMQVFGGPTGSGTGAPGGSRQAPAGNPSTDGAGASGPMLPRVGSGVAGVGPEGAACAQARAHADLNAANGGDAPPENPAGMPHLRADKGPLWFQVSRVRTPLLTPGSKALKTLAKAASAQFEKNLRDLRLGPRLGPRGWILGAVSDFA